MTTEQQQVFDRIRAFVLAGVSECESPIQHTRTVRVGLYDLTVTGRRGNGTGYAQATNMNGSHVVVECPLYFFYSDDDAKAIMLAINGEIGKRQAAEYYSAKGEADELAEVMRDWPGRGPDEDGEIFEPMSDEAMAAAQARNATLPLVDPFDDHYEMSIENELEWAAQARTW